MVDLGLYKTFLSQTFRCHFDPDNGVAFARGPLPALAKAYTVAVDDEKAAGDKLAAEIGKGVFARPLRR